MSMNTLTLISPTDVQIHLAEFIKSKRKKLKLSRAGLAERSGVPASTIKKYENTYQISLRQFILLFKSVDSLDKLIQVTKEDEFIPGSMEDIINYE